MEENIEIIDISNDNTRNIFDSQNKFMNNIIKNLYNYNLYGKYKDTTTTKVYYTDSSLNNLLLAGSIIKSITFNVKCIETILIKSIK